MTQITEWKLVPVTLTDEMREVAAHIADGPWISAQEHWDHMLAAAPPREASQAATQCTCGQSGHGNQHDPDCPQSNYTGPIKSERQERAREASQATGVGEALCTFGQPAERKPQWILKFEDADVGDMHFDDEVEAIENFKRFTVTYNCTLFVTAALAARPAVSEEVLLSAAWDEFDRINFGNPSATLRLALNGAVRHVLVLLSLRSKTGGE